MSKKKSHMSHYENNPFFVATNGFTALLSLARGVGIMFIILSILNFFTSGNRWEVNGNQENQYVEVMSAWSFAEWTLALGAGVIVFLAIALIGALFSGVSSYTAAQIAKGKTVTLGNAFRVALDHVWAYLWLNIIITVKLILWSLLFIIPGIYMTFRYSLAGVAFFDKDLRGNAAIKKSLQLTRNGWLTTFASNVLLNTLTLGVLSSAITTGVNAMLYKQFGKAGNNKPEAHWLSWVTLLGIGVLMFFAFVVVSAIAFGYAAGTYDG